MDKTPLIIDTDAGGDDAWAIMMALASQDRFDIKGISTVFGNVGLEYATNNVLNLLEFLKYENVPVYAGRKNPIVGKQVFGDDAHGEDGFGGVTLLRQGNNA